MVNGEDKIEANPTSESQKALNQPKSGMQEGETISRKPTNFSDFLHDLRSPLTAILGMVEIMKLMMEDETASKEEFNQYIQQIEQETLRLREMLS